MRKNLYKDLYLLEESHWWHRAKRELVLALIKKHINNKHATILDVGCGTGKNIEAFSSLGKTYGIDISPEAIKFCNKRGITTVRKASSYKTNFSKNKFSVITMLDLLEHTDEKKTLEETKRVLTKNGVLIITVPAFSWLWSNWDVVLHHRRRYTKKSLATCLNESGLKVEFISYMYSFLVLPAFIIRKYKSKSHQEDYSSDFLLSSKLLDAILYILTKIERYFVMKQLVPVGTSIICVVKK